MTTYQLTTLPNGLRVASEFLPGVETVAVTVSAGVGARYESASENGISHLLEHMAFKGTTTRTALDIAETFDNIGGQLNAYTSMELTVYYAKVLKENTGLAVEMLADILQHSVFDEEELAKEKSVVIQEIAMHLDSPDDLIVDIFDEVAFPDQPLGRSILSTPELVNSHSRADIIDYMQRHYAPGNLVLSAAGNIDHATLVSYAEQFFHLPPAPLPPKATPAIYAGGEKRVTSDLEQLQIALGFPTIPLHHPLYYALQIYANILGGGMSSRLFQEVREKRGLAYSVYAMSSTYTDVGMMSIYASTTPDKARELHETLLCEVRNMQKGVSENELQRAKNQARAELLMAREAPQTVAGWIGRHLLLYGRYKQSSEVIERIQAVTLDDITAVASLIVQSNPTFAALGDVSGLASQV